MVETQKRCKICGKEDLLDYVGWCDRCRKQKNLLDQKATSHVSEFIFEEGGCAK